MCKFDSSGRYQYYRIIEHSGTGNSSIPSITRDSLDNIYLVGSYFGTPTLRDQFGTLIVTLPASESAGRTHYAAFSCKFNSSGQYQYSRIVDARNSNADESGIYAS